MSFAETEMTKVAIWWFPCTSLSLEHGSFCVFKAKIDRTKGATERAVIAARAWWSPHPSDKVESITSVTAKRPEVINGGFLAIQDVGSPDLTGILVEAVAVECRRAVCLVKGPK